MINLVPHDSSLFKKVKSYYILYKNMHLISQNEGTIADLIVQ